MLRLLFWGSILVLIISCSSEESSNRLDPSDFVKYDSAQPIDSFAMAIRDSFKLPAIAIGIIDSTGQIVTTTIGTTKKENGYAVNGGSQFLIGSCTKSFTALLVATFVRDGKLDWNSTVAEVFQNMEIHADNRDITISDLLAHISGLAKFWSDEEIFLNEDLTKNNDEQIEKQRFHFASRLLADQPSFERGEFQYSNGGYVVVAAMLEKNSGLSYETLLRERILSPLKLTSAEIGYSYLQDEHQPQRHQFRDKEGYGIPLALDDRIPNPIFTPAGFIALNIHDFSKYLMHCIDMTYADTEVLPASIAKNLFTIHHDIPPESGFGLGWQISKFEGVKTYGHTGSDQTLFAAIVINAENRRGVVFATNIGDDIAEFAMFNVVSELIK